MVGPDGRPGWSECPGFFSAYWGAVEPVERTKEWSKGGNFATPQSTGARGTPCPKSGWWSSAHVGKSSCRRTAKRANFCDNEQATFLQGHCSMPMHISLVGRKDLSGE